MKILYLLCAVALAMQVVCGCKKKENYLDIFDYSEPVDMAEIVQIYDWYHEYEGADKDSLLLRKLTEGLPGMSGNTQEPEEYLLSDTLFVLRTPEYAGSEQPFLAYAEGFYNGYALAWNVWSNYEVWFRGHTAALLLDDAMVKQSIRSISADIIKNEEVRKAAQQYIDRLRVLPRIDFSIISMLMRPGG